MTINKTKVPILYGMDISSFVSEDLMVALINIIRAYHKRAKAIKYGFPLRKPGGSH